MIVLNNEIVNNTRTFESSIVLVDKKLSWQSARVSKLQSWSKIKSLLVSATANF